MFLHFLKQCVACYLLKCLKAHDISFQKIQEKIEILKKHIHITILDKNSPKRILWLVRTHHPSSNVSYCFYQSPYLTLRYYQDGMVQLQSIDQSVNQAKLSTSPQWGQMLYQVAFLFKIVQSLMKVLCRNGLSFYKFKKVLDNLT